MSKSLKDFKFQVLSFLKRNRIPLEVIINVYCKGSTPPKAFEDKLIQFEEFITQFTKDIDKFIKKVICEEIAIEREKIIQERGIVKKFEIPIIKETEVVKLILGIRQDGKIIIVNNTELGIPCREVKDLILGSVNIYIKCEDQYITFTHRLDKNTWLEIQKFLNQFI